MGGYGSGRTSRYPSVESSFRLEMPSLKSCGYLTGIGKSGIWSWSRGGKPSGSIGLKTILDEGSERIVLNYSRDGKPKDQVIYLTSVPMRFGGVRWWAICPILGLRCGTLVLSRRHDGFVSVKASGFLYATQKEDRLDRLRSKRDKYEKRYRNLSKYARSATREKVWLEYAQSDEKFEEAMDEKLQWFRAKIKKISANLDL